MDELDDFKMDESFYLADLWMEQADAIASLLDALPDDPDWELHISEPSDEELEEMNRAVEAILMDLQ